MNKTDLIDQIAGTTELNKAQSGAALAAVLDAIQGELKNGGRVSLIGFGTFSVSERASRSGRNPKTGEAMSIPASRAIRFVPGKPLKDTVNSVKAAPAVDGTGSKAK